MAGSSSEGRTGRTRSVGTKITEGGQRRRKRESGADAYIFG